MRLNSKFHMRDPFIQLRAIVSSQDIREIVIVFHEYRLLYLLDTVIFEHSMELVSNENHR